MGLLIYLSRASHSRVTAPQGENRGYAEHPTWAASLLSNLVGPESRRLGVEVPELGHEFLVGAATLVGLGVFPAAPGGHGDALAGGIDGLEEVVEAVAPLPVEDAPETSSLLYRVLAASALAGSLLVKVMRTNIRLFSPSFLLP